MQQSFHCQSLHNQYSPSLCGKIREKHVYCTPNFISGGDGLSAATNSVTVLPSSMGGMQWAWTGVGSLKPIAETWRISHSAKPSKPRPDMPFAFKIIKLVSELLEVHMTQVQGSTLQSIYDSITNTRAHNNGDLAVFMRSCQYTTTTTTQKPSFISVTSSQHEFCWVLGLIFRVSFSSSSR